MSDRDDVIAALEFRPPAKTPFFFPMTAPAREKLLAATDGKHPLFEQGDSFVWHKVHHRGFEEIRPGHFRDIFGVVWNRTLDRDIGVVENEVLPEPSLSTLTLPDPDAPMLYEGAECVKAEHPDKFFMGTGGFSLWERAWSLRGMTALMMDLIENPAFVHDLLDAICDWNVRVIRNCLQLGIDGYHFGDDWGQQTGLLISGDHWREFLKPRLARMYGAVRDGGSFVSIHSCGKVEALFDDLVEIGLDCFNPFQPEVMDVDALYEAYFGRLAFNGGISTQRLMPYGSPDDVRQEVERMVATKGRRGGYITAPAHALASDVPAENMLAMLDVLMNQ